MRGYRITATFCPWHFSQSAKNEMQNEKLKKEIQKVGFYEYCLECKSSEMKKINENSQTWPELVELFLKQILQSEISFAWTAMITTLHLTYILQDVRFFFFLHAYRRFANARS